MDVLTGSYLDTSGIYIHIPFCDHKCIYCDFYSIITTEKKEEFLSALQAEIRNRLGRHPKHEKIATVFFGGGTPSLLEPAQLKAILDTVRQHAPLADDAEITLETNPGTVDPEKLAGYREAGINRLSIGIQSFHDDDLEFLTRIHNRQTAIDTVNAAAGEGFSNINVDLIFNLPGQTTERWRENLAAAADLPVTHISAYSLMLERGTILNKMVLDGKVTIGSEDWDAGLYEMTIEELARRGFEQYEVSNFARGGEYCRHNLIYWRYGTYYGLGPSAHSFIHNVRSWNYSGLTLYLNAMKENGIAEAGSETIQAETMSEEYVMLALRSSGLNLKEYRHLFGEAYEQLHEAKLRDFAERGWVTTEHGILRLTPAGYTIGDELLNYLT